MLIPPATTTASAEAQRYFDQALNWTYAFNHDEAIPAEFSKDAAPFSIRWPPSKFPC